MPRRRSDPREFAAILQRLERLRAGPSAPGWVPVAPDAAPGARPSPNAAPPGALSRGARSDGAPAGDAAFQSFAERWRSATASRQAIFDPGRRGATVLAGLALLGALAGAWYFIAARPAAGSAPGAVSQSNSGSPGSRSRGSVPAPGSGPAAGDTTPPASVLSGWPTTAASIPRPIVVDVVGKVAAPGVVELPAGARIRDAIQAAGGALPGTDLTALDLASRLSDGQEIFVGIPPPTGAAAQSAGGVVGGNPPADASGGGGSTSSGIVDLNAATLTDLETLPGVGPVLAQHILDWRTQHGRFTAITQLQQVSGIGPSKYAALAGRVRV